MISLVDTIPNIVLSIELLNVVLIGDLVKLDLNELPR